MWLVMVVLCVAVGTLSSPPVVHANSNLRTLRSFQTHACDGDELRISCSSNTVVSITMAQYGKPVLHDLLCPAETRSTHTIGNYSDVPDCPITDALEIVENACKDKQECTLKILPKLFGKESCLSFQKYVEVSYKCRPNTLLTKIVCEGEKIKLRCRKVHRIVIYNASFGSSRLGVPECPQQTKHKSEDCQASYVTETVMDICHGRLKCSLTADLATFGDPGCTKKAHLYLKVVYICVPKDILQDLVLEHDTSDQDYSSLIEESLVSSVARDHKEREEHSVVITTSDYRSDDLLEPTVTTTKEADVLSDGNTNNVLTDINCTVVEKEQRVVGFITEWISAYKFIRENKEKLILYMTVSLGTGVLAFLVVLAARLYIQQQRQLRNAKLNISDPLPLSLDDDCSDVDQYDPRHDHHSVEVVRYTDTSTVRRQDSDSQPRAPLSHSMNNYYYS